LIHELLRQWQLYAGYVISFLTIGIIWINHHMMISRLREVDRTILLLNLLLLMCIAVLPFSTELVAAYLKAARGEKLAAGVYSGSFLLMSIAFSALNHHILLRKPERLQADLPEEHRRRILSRSISGLVPYVVATALAFVSAYVTLAICAAVAVFYAFPIASGAQYEPAGS
jgi:uncharacterized membrane protein